MSVWCSTLTFTDDEPVRSPLVYRESHVIPTAEDLRGGELSLAALPGFLTRTGSDDGVDGAWWPYLRVSLRSPKPEEDTVVLDVDQVDALIAELADWRGRVAPELT
jgi:hypothetical protein